MTSGSGRTIYIAMEEIIKTILVLIYSKVVINHAIVLSFQVFLAVGFAFGCHLCVTYLFALSIQFVSGNYFIYGQLFSGKCFFEWAVNATSCRANGPRWHGRKYFASSIASRSTFPIV